MPQVDLATSIIRRLGELKGLRSPNEDTWRQCGDYSFPIRSQGFYGEREELSGTQTKQAEMYDSTAPDAARILASSTQTGSTPSNTRWFGLTVQDQEDGERQWLDESAQSLWTEIHASNFDAESMDGLLDMVAFGWFVMFVNLAQDDDGSVNGFQFELWPIGSCYCAASTPAGPIDTVFRPYCLTVEQCVSQFGMANVSEKVRELYQSEKYDEKVNLIHAIYPRRHGRQGAARARNMPFASVYVDCDSKQVVRESGFHEQPFFAPRWTRIPNSVYAVGPMFEALPDTKTVNKLAQMELANADIAVAGMWIAEDDGVLNPRTVKVGPRKIIVANSVDSMKPLVTGADFNISFTKRADLEAKIRKIMMADQLPPMEGQPRTATEFYARINLIRQLLGPVYGRMQSEYLKPMIGRCFGLAFRAGLFDAPPQSLAGRPYSIVYLSPMAKSQKLEEVSAIEGTFAAVAQLAAAKGDPTVWDNYDVDEGMRIAADGRGVPAKIVRNADDVAEIRKIRAQQQEQAQQQAMQQQIGMEAASAGIQRMAQQ
ncbi:portal protein [Achromobacter xylosoxidans]|uniref:portal protein n=1 Tax=Alcaligenes xylosoxydans xylosoxydans TaxID=85698 RepID=UPI001C52E2F2|nr:portal protein [Achromobacter xylosoxidans]